MCAAFAEVERDSARLLILAPRSRTLRRKLPGYRGIAAKLLAPKQPKLNGTGARSCLRPAACCCSIAWRTLRASIDSLTRCSSEARLFPSGGHNILEPAAFSKVPVYGPSMDNFREMRRSSSCGRGRAVNTPEALGSAWIALLKED